MISIKNFHEGVLELSGYSIAASIALGCLSSIFPPAVFIGAALMGTGCAGIGYYFTKHSKFDRFFKEVGLCNKLGAFPQQINFEQKEGRDEYLFSVPGGLTSEDFESCKLEFEQYIDKKIEISYDMKKRMKIEVFNSEVGEKIYEPKKLNGILPFPVAFNRHGKLVWCDLGKNEPHALVAGTSNAGKSNLLKLIASNILLTEINNVDLYLGDFKGGAEFGIFERCRGVAGFAKDFDEMKRIIAELKAEAEKRYELFYDDDDVINNLKEYNQKHRDKPLKRKLLIIDEFAEMMYEKESIKMLISLLSKARAGGIHVILGTQRPDKDVLTGLLKANIGTVIGLHTVTGTNSEIIIDHLGLEKLTRVGQCIVSHSGKETECQIPLFDYEVVRKKIETLYKPKPQKQLSVAESGVIKK